MFIEASEILVAENTLPSATAWAVVRTGARWEKSVKRFFDECGISSFLPLVERRRVYGRRIRLSQLPLFSGYVFFDFDSIAREELFKCDRIAQVLVPDDPVELRKDLEMLARALLHPEEIRAGQDYKPGTPVEVKHGPMKGIVGELVRTGSENLLVIKVRFLGATAEMEIDEALVQAIK